MTMPDGRESLSYFHTSDDKYRQYSDSALKKAVNSQTITQDDADLIREFVEEVKSTSKKFSDARRFKLTVTLVHLREFFPHPFRDSTITEVNAVKGAIEQAKKRDKETGEETNIPRYMGNTVADFIRFMKRFLRWMVENGYSSIPDKKLKNIKPPAYNYGTKTADMLFSEEDVHAMLTACQNSRDRAIISVLYDGALRIGELGTLRWNQVTFTDVNATLKIKFKTDKDRCIPLFMAKEYLAAWKNDYPGEPAGDAFVFLTANGGGKRIGHNQLQYAGVAKQIKKIAIRAGITRKITPHIFRHSRITHLVRAGTQESMVKMLGWGSTTTDMLDKCYLHLQDADVIREMAKNAGVEMDEKPRSKVLEPRQCPHCGEINGPTRRWCVKCETALTDDAREKVTVATEQAEALPEFAQLLQQMKEMQNEIIALKKAKGSA